GSARGSRAVRDSLNKYGAGRSILLDKYNRIIAGNSTASNAGPAGLDENVIVVESDGTQLIAVRRTDLDLDDPKARELSIADNRTSELGLSWDSAVLAELTPALDLGEFFTSAELLDLSGDKPTPTNPADEWVGLPEYESKDVAVRDI